MSAETRLGRPTRAHRFSRKKKRNPLGLKWVWMTCGGAPTLPLMGMLEARCLRAMTSTPPGRACCTSPATCSTWARGGGGGGGGSGLPA